MRTGLAGETVFAIVRVYVRFGDEEPELSSL